MSVRQWERGVSLCHFGGTVCWSLTQAGGGEGAENALQRHEIPPQGPASGASELSLPCKQGGGQASVILTYFL